MEGEGPEGDRGVTALAWLPGPLVCASDSRLPSTEFRPSGVEE